jgi:hypothetical protein
MLNEEQRKEVIERLKNKERQIDIAKGLGIKASVVNYFARSMKEEYLMKDCGEYFNEHSYFKTVSTI